MTDEGLFRASVPVFLHYLSRIGVIVSRCPEGSAALSERIAPDTFTAGEHLETAQGFTLRATFPLIGRDVPELSNEAADSSALLRRGKEASALLAALEPQHFNGAAQRIITHRAGMADLTQSAAEFLSLYALPNFFFHLTMGYATLRQSGLPLGKADYDGLHSYPSGFRF